MLRASSYLSLAIFPVLPRGLSTVGFRKQDVIDVAWHRRLSEVPLGTSTHEARQNYYCDISQGVQRKPFRFGGGTFTTNSCWYSYQEDVTLDGEDVLRIQGAPVRTTTLGSFKDSDLRTCGGEAFSVPSIGTFLYSLYLNPYGGWWR